VHLHTEGDTLIRRRAVTHNQIRVVRDEVLVADSIGVKYGDSEREERCTIEVPGRDRNSTPLPVVVETRSLEPVDT
jgi:hypothetical protein